MSEGQIKVERILDDMQESRDYYLLKEINGEKAAGKMILRYRRSIQRAMQKPTSESASDPSSSRR